MSDDLVEQLRDDSGREACKRDIPDFPCAALCPCALELRILADADELDRLRAENERLRAENERLREALTPGADTKAAYMGEFHMGITLRHPRTGEEDRRRAQIPWDTIKEIMAAIRARATIQDKGDERCLLK